MIRAADEAGLDAVGITDHCAVPGREPGRDDRAVFGFNLDLTYPRRRRGIDRLRDRFGLEVYDAVEMNYDPRDEDAIREFLGEAGFEYAIGSVHRVPAGDVQSAGDFEGLAGPELDAVVEQYFDRLTELIDSELFDVAAHPDLIERTEPLRGRATRGQYRRVAAAFERSRTLPEINAGRALREESVVHPSGRFLEALLERDVEFVLGSDSHRPGEIEPRAEFLGEFAAEHGIDPVAPPGLDR